MRKAVILFFGVCLFFTMATAGICAYHHEGENDADKFLSAYPDKAGTKLDHCALCHTGGSYESSKGTVSLGSCQWCHYSYGYNGAGEIDETMNPYGERYKAAGRTMAAVEAIENEDSDDDGSTNKEEIDANTFPGNPNDYPGLVVAPHRVYSRAQLESMGQHTQFLLLNTSRSGDFYAEYTGIVLKDLLEDAGILDGATGITVFAPDGWSQYHPLMEDEAQTEFYHINGTYPEAEYFYDTEADVAENPVIGWCDYSAISCAGRNNGDAIVNPDGNKVILAYRREGALMDPGVLNTDNKLDGEGPFRVVPPQKLINPPDQSSKSANQDVIWPYMNEWDHNAGASTRTVTIIRVEPLPEGTTDIDILEAGWPYVDQNKVIIYGAIDGTDSNGNGILDSEEKGGNPDADFDGDGQKDFEDPQTAMLRQGNGDGKLMLHAENGELKQVQALGDDDPAVPQTNRPAETSCPYGVLKFQLTGLDIGESVALTIVYPENVPENAVYYKVSAANGWREIPIEAVDGKKITITLTDGDPLTDADGIANGVIVDPSALLLDESEPEPVADGGGGGGGCFIDAVLKFIR